MLHVSDHSDYRAPRSIHVDPLAQRIGGVVGADTLRYRLIHHDGFSGVFGIVYLEVPSGAQGNSDGAKIAGADTARLSDEIRSRRRRVAFHFIAVTPVLAAER